jgi:MurNAc alpha-1-phosphate uridylyltransferase
MKAMILAAGEGRRMRPLTDQMPKPLLPVGGVPLIERHIVSLAAAGITEIVVNTSHLADQLSTFLGSGDRWGVDIVISHEASPLETAGGIILALPLLGNQPFLVVNGDIYTDYPFERLHDHSVTNGGAHLVCVDNPPHHPEGDFMLSDGRVIAEVGASGDLQPTALPDAAAAVTFSGIGCYSPAFFAGCQPGKQPLKPLMVSAMQADLLSGEHYPGEWQDVGTPERLAILDNRLAQNDPSQ